MQVQTLGAFRLVAAAAAMMLAFGGLLAGGAGASGAGELSVVGTDTIAGFSAELRAAGALPGGELSFRVEKPDGGVIDLAETADERGVARVNFLGFHTRVAGEYRVEARAAGLANVARSRFEVFAGSPDLATSTIAALEAEATADGRAEARVRVRLLDEFYNPVEGHVVSVISSRPDDEIYPVSTPAATDARGEVLFAVRSQTEGVAHLSAFDQSSATTLSGRARVVFFAPAPEAAAANRRSFGGASLFGANLLGSGAGVVAALELEFPPEVEVGSDSNFLRIRAVDAFGATVPTYTGTVLISTPADPDAVLPGGGEYTFAPRDGGVRDFNLALIFRTAGEQTIAAHDITGGVISRTIRGEAKVLVQERCEEASCSLGGNASSKKIHLKTPSTDARFASRTVSVSGQASAYSNVLFFVDGQNAGLSSADGDGFFLGTIRDLAEGEHLLYVRDESDADIRSDEIGFVVDSRPPDVQDASVQPSGTEVPAGSTVKVAVFSEVGLPKATAVINAQQHTLTEESDTPGKYAAVIRVPESAGQFEVRVELEDGLGNLANQVVGTVQVAASEDEPEPTDQPAIAGAPTGLNAEVGAESGSVLLNWEAQEGAQEYVIFSGTNDLFLSEIGSSPNNEFTATGLATGLRMFFAVAAKNVAGEVSGRSAAVDIIIEDRPTPQPPAPPEPKPEPTPPTPPPSAAIFAAPTPGGVQISFANLPAGASWVRVAFGTSAQDLFEHLTIPATARSAEVRDLLPDLQYTFRAFPMDNSGVILHTGSGGAASEFPTATARPLPAPGVVASAPPANLQQAVEQLFNEPKPTPPSPPAVPATGILGGNSLGIGATMLVFLAAFALLAAGGLFGLRAMGFHPRIALAAIPRFSA